MTFTIKSDAIDSNGKSSFHHIIKNMSAEEISNYGAQSLVWDYAEQAASALDANTDDIEDEIDEAIDWVNDWLDTRLSEERESVTIIDESNITRQKSYRPNCPICGIAPDDEADIDNAYDCGHFVGTFNSWYDEDGQEYVLLANSTHEIRINHGIGGITSYFFGK